MIKVHINRLTDTIDLSLNGVEFRLIAGQINRSNTVFICINGNLLHPVDKQSCASRHFK